MKFHRVLLFTTIQMDITPVGDDLHILLTGGDQHRIGCTAWSVPQPPDTDTPAEPQPDVPEKTTAAEVFAAAAEAAAAAEDTSSIPCETTVIKSDDNADASFCAYVAENIAKKPGSAPFVPAASTWITRTNTSSPNSTKISTR